MCMFLRTSAYPTYGIHVCPTEPNLIALKRGAMVFHTHSEGWHNPACVSVIVRILNKLEYKVSRFRVQFFRQTVRIARELRHTKNLAEKASLF